MIDVHTPGGTRRFGARRAPVVRDGSLAILCLLVAGCGTVKRSANAVKRGASAVLHRHTHPWNPPVVTTTRGVSAAELQTAIGKRIQGDPPVPITGDSWRHVQRMYARYANGPLWLTNEGLDRNRVGALLRVLASADSDALSLDAYPLAELGRAVSVVDTTAHPSADQLATADVLLTASFMTFGANVLTGQLNPSTLSQSWHIAPQYERIDSALAGSLRSEPLADAIALMRPQDPDYAALQAELIHYRSMVAQGDWPTVPAGPMLHPGQSGPAARIAALRDRLQAESFPLDSGVSPTIYTRRLAGAVAEFQALHGIPVDSLLGPATVASLNVPSRYRLGQIAANLERMRWLPSTLGSRYIVVNVPAFHLAAYDSGQKVLEMKVIVGADYLGKTTPVFSDIMKTVVFRPYWDITPDIARKETIPRIRADTGYMTANDLEYYRADGQQFIRQKPGPKNSLGLVKFLFPNDFNVYLHDTPEGDLFKKDVRAFSHGCIRLEKPAALAQFVLGWPADSVTEAMQHGADNRRVNLPDPIPVYIVYLTAYVADSALHFGNDLYQRDDKMVAAVANGAQPSPAAEQSAAALRAMADGWGG